MCDRLMAAASSSSALPWKYDVFINFRGEDTRRGFVSHLYRALCQKPINTFIDAEDLGKGDRISELMTAIRESRISIVVFSQNYASSTWCLKELVQILECKDTDNQIVLPIFYQVDPSDVRKLKRSFEEAFAHYNRDSNTEMEEVRSWRSALTTATGLSGWDSRNYGDDAELIEKIVEDVFRKLNHISSTSSKDNGLVEMDSHMHNMRSLLHPLGVETNDVRVVGIWGMGGLGKTTIARAVYDEIACRFEACCFLEDVKEGFMRHGKLHMQTELLSSISNNKVGFSDISKIGFQKMLNSLGQRKVLIVLDDVDTFEQIEALLGKQHSFGGGSRIIITTRDLQLLRGADATYEPKIFSDPGALELFRCYAFRTNKPTRDYDDLSSRAVNYAQGLPLALKVLGSFLDNKTVREWEDVLEKLKEVPPKGINDVLRTSIDGLDRTEKNIFLDIACFFKGMNKDYAIEVLDSCGFYPHNGIRVLIDRALITVSVNGKLEMHDLLEEVGLEIVRLQSIEEPGRRSRLWSYEDIHRVLTQNTGTEAIESIILHLSGLHELRLNAEAFVCMTRLRLLKISCPSYNLHLNGHLKLLSRELRCLSWHSFPLKSLASNCQFENLVDLDMRCSLIDRLWDGTQTLEKLKFIDLSYCKYLKETPDFTKVPNLERLILQGCISLVEVHPSISTLTNLVLLNLNGCNELKILASSIHMKSLKTLDLFGCSSLEMFPDILEVMEELSQLNLSGSKIKELPSSINTLTGLRYLFLKDCKELKSLPSRISMKSLKTLDVSGCSSLEMFPEILEVMEELPQLNLSGSKIKKLPSSINNLRGLRFLFLKDCKELKSLPSNICMKSLKTLDLSGCSSLEMFPAICTRSLETLDLSGCSSLEMFPEILEVMGKLLQLNLSGLNIKELPLSINNLTELSYLNLKDCKELNSLPSSICQLKSLTYVTLSGCTKFGVFPNIVENMEGLRELHLDGTSIKELSPSIERLQGLEYLNMRNCKSLVHLPDTLCNLARLLALNLCGCPNLSQLPVNLVRLRDNGVELDNWHTNILTGVQHSQTSSSSTTEIGSESLTREQHSQTSSTSTSSKDNGLVEMGSSSSGLHSKYKVFINFRWEDTGRGFVNHLYKALRQKKINTLIDSEELRKGDRFSELLTAIRESRLSIVVFSQNYAYSTWCLKELVEILECKDTKSQIVLPIFYEVDPSDIRNLKGSFAEAFAKHERHSNVDVKEVQSWRSALARATYLSGWNSLNYKDDAELIEKIVEDVFRKVIHISSTSSKDNGLVGMDSHMHEMHLRLHLDPPGVELDDVRVVGIWGMGGLGKSTIARAVYNEISCQFEACCFLENVKEGFMKHDKLHMQTQLLSSISKNKMQRSDILEKGFQVMLNSLSQRKVLIVVDDVDKLEQIEALLGEQHSFGGGSRIIITTRDKQLLNGADAIYAPKILCYPGALELFRLHAFRKKQPTRDYDDLSSRAVNYAQGLPLALKFLGAFLYNKTVRVWEDVLRKIRKVPNGGIINVLQTSFNGLDHKEQNIFLDIACFFKGMGKDFATEILDSCGFNPHTGIRVLIDRALITVSEGGILEMHDLLEEMAREIVRQECIKEPGRRSRLWSYEDVHHVLTQNTATKAVESIILDLSNSDVRFINTNAFVCMTRLRLLKINHKYKICKDFYFVVQHLIGHSKFHSDELRCLSWIGFPLKSLPSNFRFKNLVDLDMQYSLIDRLWEGTQTLEKLKFINLSYSQYLKETPDFTKVPNLEQLILQNCTSLIEVHPSIETHTNIVLLNLNGCKKLKVLATSIRMKSLKTLDLCDCSSLEMFPDILEVMEKLSELNLSRSKIKELPSSINNLTGLCYLDLKDCKELKSLPNNICQLKSLTYVTLSGCTKFEVFPSIEENMERLRELHLDGTSIRELSPSIERLQGLVILNLRDCKSLVDLPDTLCNLERLEDLNLSGCPNLSITCQL